MPEPSSAPSLEHRLRALELELDDLRPQRRRRTPTPARPSRARRILVSISVIATIGLLPMVAVASDTFTDVPDSNQFHAAINNLYDARITRGCTTTPPLQYCPTSNVNRQQMAGFLNRGLGRTSGAQGSANVTADTTVSVTSVSVDTGGLTGGSGFVLVTGAVSAYTLSGTTCPCTVGMRVRNATLDDEPFLWEFASVDNTTTPWVGSDFRFGTASMTWVFPVASGVSQTFDIRATVDMTGATGELTLQGHITALYVPFGSTGGSTLGALNEAPSTNGLGD